MDTSGNFVYNLILFGRLLRALGLDVNPGRTIDLIRALKYIDLGEKAEFYFTARSLLVHRREDLALFDRAFEAFWRPPGEAWLEVPPALAGGGKRRLPAIAPSRPGEPAAGSAGDSPDAGRAEEPGALEITLTYSERELLRRKDFANLSEAELHAIRRLISSLAWNLGGRRSRRLESSEGRRLDLRRTLRGNMRYGGEILAWARRHPKIKPRPLVVIADVSGSMERYTRLLLYFTYSLSEGMRRKVEAFVFSTRLSRITRQLHSRDADLAIQRVSRQVADWAGGTRIGEALKAFNFSWSRRVLGRGAVVLLISDGWDRGDPNLLQLEMARLQRSAYRLIWLNPLLGSQAYEPLTRGMQAALPYLDDFLPVHNLASLEDLAERLQQVDRSRPQRRQVRPRWV